MTPQPHVAPSPDDLLEAILEHETGTGKRPLSISETDQNAARVAGLYSAWMNGLWDVPAARLLSLAQNYTGFDLKGWMNRHGLMDGPT